MAACVGNVNPCVVQEAIYGHFDAPRNCPQHPIKAKILILHGYNDPISPMNELDLFQQELEKGKVEWQSHLYGHTFHAFANPTANNPKAGLIYNPLSAQHAWHETEDFLKTLFSQ